VRQRTKHLAAASHNGFGFNGDWGVDRHKPYVLNIRERLIQWRTVRSVPPRGSTDLICKVEQPLKNR